MYWLQKARLLCSTQQRTDQLENIIRNRLSGLSMHSPLFLQQQIDGGVGLPRLIIFAEYNIKAEADSVWDDVTTANTNGWIVTPSFAVYAEMNDDQSPSAILSRTDW